MFDPVGERAKLGTAADAMLIDQYLDAIPTTARRMDTE